MAFAFQSKKTSVTSRSVSAQLKKQLPGKTYEDQAVEFADSVTLDRPVLRADCVLQGFFLKYDDGDHNYGTERIGVRGIEVDGATVKYKTFCLIHDVDAWNYPLGHPFHGNIRVLTLAELDDAGLEPPSGVDFRRASIPFQISPVRNRVEKASVKVASRASWAEPMLRSIRMEYGSDDEDYFLQQAQVEVARIRDDVVDLEGHFKLQDVVVFGGEDPALYDKQTQGEFEVVVLAGLAEGSGS
jgi:hypothetical protein